MFRLVKVGFEESTLPSVEPNIKRKVWQTGEREVVDHFYGNESTERSYVNKTEKKWKPCNDPIPYLDINIGNTETGSTKVQLFCGGRKESKISWAPFDVVIGLHNKEPDRKKLILKNVAKLKGSVELLDRLDCLVGEACCCCTEIATVGECIDLTWEMGYEFVKGVRKHGEHYKEMAETDRVWPMLKGCGIMLMPCKETKDLKRQLPISYGGAILMDLQDGSKYMQFLTEASAKGETLDTGESAFDVLTLAIAMKQGLEHAETLNVHNSGVHVVESDGMQILGVCGTAFELAYGGVPQSDLRANEDKYPVTMGFMRRTFYGTKNWENMTLARIEGTDSVDKRKAVAERARFNTLQLCVRFTFSISQKLKTLLNLREDCSHAGSRVRRAVAEYMKHAFPLPRFCGYRSSYETDNFASMTADSQARLRQGVSAVEALHHVKRALFSDNPSRVPYVPPGKRGLTWAKSSPQPRDRKALHSGHKNYRNASGHGASSATWRGKNKN